MGYQSGNVLSTALAFRATATGIGTRFLCDNEMIDKDVPSIEALAAANGDDPQMYMEDNNNDWFIDLPPGSTLQVPTGQVGDTGLFDIDHNAFPFTSESSPSHTDFLNYNEDGGPRDNPDVKALLDPLVGVSPVDDPGVYVRPYTVLHELGLYNDYKISNLICHEGHDDMPSALAAGRFDEITAIDNALDTRNQRAPRLKELKED